MMPQAIAGTQPQRGALPPAFGSPRDIFGTDENPGKRSGLHLSINLGVRRLAPGAARGVSA